MALVITKYCSIKNGRVNINGREVFSSQEEGYKKFMRACYKHYEVDYAKFFKMDSLSKLGFISIEILLKAEDIGARHAIEKTGIILTNHSSSLEVDEKHQDTIMDRNQYFPSPSNFVYTLPNIMAGEAAIRHVFRGENTVLISESFDPELIHNIISLAFTTKSLSCCICGWVEQYSDQYESVLFLVEENGNPEEENISKEDIIFGPSNMLSIYKQEQK